MEFRHFVQLIAIGLQARIPMHMTGFPGVGKTEFTKSLETGFARVGIKCKVFVLVGSIREPQDFGGFPVSTPDGHSVSSTFIRRAIAGGDLDRAAASLGRLYSVSGRVIEGAQRGRTIGFPTLNLGFPPPRKLLPPEGVYVVRVQTPAGPVGGMMNLGPRPTFGDSTTSLEAHLFDTAGNFYGAHVRVDFVARLRETRKFASAEQLSSQLRHDEREARNALTQLQLSGNLTG